MPLMRLLLRPAVLMQVLDQVPDPRSRRGRRHGLGGLLGQAVTAVIAGARPYAAAIAQWAADLSIEQRFGLGATRADAPDASTFRRVLSGLDVQLLDALLGAYLWTRTDRVGARRVIAIGGKTIRGAHQQQRRREHRTTPRLVAAFDHTTGAVVGQLATAAKSNEIPTVRTLLKVFDLTNVVVTIDTHPDRHRRPDRRCRRGLRADREGNQPTLYAACKALPWKNVPAHTATTRARGKRTTRAIKVVQAPAWITFTAAAQVAQIHRTATRDGKKTVEVVYVITSADHHAASPPTLASWVQNHWGIENKLHWVRDVSYDEDRSQVRTRNGPHVMATLRNTAISLLRLTGTTNIAAGLRHHAARPDRPINLILT